MLLRSLLFIPGDSERKLAKGPSSGADALILDLEDAVAAARKPAAREIVAGFLSEQTAGQGPSLFVRINPLDSGCAADDLAAVIHAAPYGIVLPKAAGAADIDRLAAMIEQHERAAGLTPGQTRILPIVTETPAAIFALGSYASCDSRLLALTWGTEDLSAAVGATTNRTDDGRWTPPYELARSLCLFGAAAAGVLAVDTLHADFRDSDGLAASCREARRDGFAGKLAIHPAQVAVINDGFAPDANDVERAGRIVALFAENPEAGTLALDGRMLDRPHLVQAERTLAMAAAIRDRR